MPPSNTSLICMKLTSQDDKRLVDQMEQWMEQQKDIVPDPHMREAVTLLLCRLVRAFSYRSTKSAVEPMTAATRNDEKWPSNGWKPPVPQPDFQQLLHQQQQQQQQQQSAFMSTLLRKGQGAPASATDIIRNNSMDHKNASKSFKTASAAAAPPASITAKMIRQLELSSPVVEALVGVASDLALYLHDKSKQQQSLLTVAEVSSHCQWFLETLLQHGAELLYRQVVAIIVDPTESTTTATKSLSSPFTLASPILTATPAATTATTVPPSLPTVLQQQQQQQQQNPLDELKFKMFLSKSLQSFTQWAVSSTEAYADFCYMYAVCEESRAFRSAFARLAEYDDAIRSIHNSTNTTLQSNNNSNTTTSTSPLNVNNKKRKLSSGHNPTYEQRKSHMKKLSWKLSCLVTLYLRSRNDSYPMDRRQRLMLSAASLALLASFPVEMTVVRSAGTPTTTATTTTTTTMPSSTVAGRNPPTFGAPAITTAPSLRTDGSAWNVVKRKTTEQPFAPIIVPASIHAGNMHAGAFQQVVTTIPVDEVEGNAQRIGGGAGGASEKDADTGNDGAPILKRRRSDPHSTMKKRSVSSPSWSDFSTASEGDDSSTGDAVDVIVNAVNNIRIFLSWACTSSTSNGGGSGGGSGGGGSGGGGSSGGGMMGADVTKADVHWEMLNLVEHALKGATQSVKVSGQKQADTNLVYLCLQSQLIKPSLWKTYAELSNIERLYQAIMSLFTSKPWTGEPTKRRLESVPFVDEASLNGDLVARLCRTSQSRPSNVSISGSSGAPYHDVVATTLNYHDSSSRVFTMVMERTVRPSTPPVITEAMELNEWTLSLLSFTVIRPNKRLMTYLEASEMTAIPGGICGLMVPILNRALIRIAESTSTGVSDRLSVSVSCPDGTVCIHGQPCLTTQVNASLIAFYYHALEAILYQETTRRKTRDHRKLLLQDSFHRSLLACCYVCVIKAVGASGKVNITANHPRFDIYSILQVIETSPFSYLKVSEATCRALTFELSRGKLGSPLAFGLPRIIQRHLKFTEVQVLDSLLWSRGACRQDEGSIMQYVQELKQVRGGGYTCWPPEPLEPRLPEEVEDLGLAKAGPSTTVAAVVLPFHSFVSFICRKVLKVGYFRIQSLCSALSIPNEHPVGRQVFLAFRHFLRHYFTLLYDRHVDQFLLCTLYGVVKAMKYKPEITFTRLADVYVTTRSSELGERTCHRIVRHLKLAVDEDAAKVCNKLDGDIIELYNLLYVPAMKSYLLGSKALKRDAMTLKIMLDGKNRSTSADSPATAARPVVPEVANNKKTIIREGNVAIKVTIATSPLTTAPAGDVQSSKRPLLQGLNTFLYFGGCQSKPIDVTNELTARNNFECSGT